MNDGHHRLIAMKDQFGTIALNREIMLVFKKQADDFGFRRTFRFAARV